MTDLKRASMRMLTADTRLNGLLRPVRLGYLLKYLGRYMSMLVSHT